MAAAAAGEPAASTVVAAAAVPVAGTVSVADESAGAAELERRVGRVGVVARGEEVEQAELESELELFETVPRLIPDGAASVVAGSGRGIGLLLQVRVRVQGRMGQRGVDSAAGCQSSTRYEGPGMA